MSPPVWTILVCLVSFGDAQTQLTEPFGSFSSPNYPEVYGNDINQIWNITVKPHYRVKLEFTTFDLEDSYEEGRACVYDYVKISEGSKEIARLCGNRQDGAIDAPRYGQLFFTDGNNATVEFVSDYSNEGIQPRGFLAHYSEIDIDECRDMRQKEQYTIEDWDELLTCDHFCNNVPGSYYCSCRAGYILHSDGYTCIAKFCEDNVLSDDNGTIESPGYEDGKYYSKYADCSWNITVREGMSVNLYFIEDFAIEEHHEEGCVYDALKIKYDGQRGKTDYCGTSLPQNISTNTRNVMVTFTSDRSVEMGGFKIIYDNTRIRCLQPLTTPDHGSKSDIPSRGYYEFEDVVTFTCDIGYEFKPGDSPLLECLSDGRWSHEQPECQIKVCGDPTNLRSVSYGRVVNLTGEFVGVYGEKVVFKCDDWYEMTEGSAVYTCTDEKLWKPHSGNIASSKLPKCRPSCGQKTNIASTQPGPVEPHEWPWVVLLITAITGHLDDSFFCTGSLISSRYVLTAAHCLKTDADGKDRKRKPDEIHPWIGVHDRNDASTGRKIPAEEIVMHSGYKLDATESIEYDIGLVRLTVNVHMSDSVRPICLPDNGRNLLSDGVGGYVAGWSLFDGNPERGPNVLSHAEFPLVPNERCTTWRNTNELNVHNPKNVFCAGYNNSESGSNSASACPGDSGGPFMMNISESVYEVVGLVSHGVTNCDEGGRQKFTIYTYITAEILEWILNQTHNLE